MLLTVDIGNTNISIGVFDMEKLVFESRIATDKNKLSDEYSIIIRSILTLYGLAPNEMTGAIISSVVPKLTLVLQNAINKIAAITPLLVGPGIKTGLNIKVENPSQMGSDIVANAVAAIALFPVPIIMIDMGTATTINVIDGNGSLVGTAIIPGARISLDALSQSASQLPEVGIEPSKDILGTNTVDSMKAGIIFGTASMLDGMIDRINEKLGQTATVVATGGLSGIIIPTCKSNIIHDPHLLLKGLQLIYYKNHSSR